MLYEQHPVMLLAQILIVKKEEKALSHLPLKPGLELSDEVVGV